MKTSKVSKGDSKVSKNSKNFKKSKKIQNFQENQKSQITQQSSLLHISVSFFGLFEFFEITIFLNFFDFTGKILLLVVTFFSFRIFSSFFKVLYAFFRRRMQKLWPI